MKIAELLIEGVWCRPPHPPLQWLRNCENDTVELWGGFIYVYHPEHGHFRVRPDRFPIRIVDD